MPGSRRKHLCFRDSEISGFSVNYACAYPVSPTGSRRTHGRESFPEGVLGQSEEADHRFLVRPGNFTAAFAMGKHFDSGFLIPETLEEIPEFDRSPFKRIERLSVVPVPMRSIYLISGHFAAISLFSAISDWWSRVESNHYLRLRRPSSYPLDHGTSHLARRGKAVPGASPLGKD